MTARDDAYEGRAMVAAFADRATAREAARALHDEGFHHTWIGVTQPSDAATYGGAGGAIGRGGTTVEPDADDSVADKLGRFFSRGEVGGKTLYDALVRHGVAESEARRIDGSLAPHSAILTVDGGNHPELAAEVIEEFGGHVLAGEHFGDDATAEDAGAGLRGSRLLGYGAAAEYARGAQIDERRRLALREERLSIDTMRVPLGEVAIGKDVVEHRQNVDVPVVREELFIERRSASEATLAQDAGEISAGETIRIPLMREQVMVTKRPVVTSEVVVGKREVIGTQHVSETTREERLRVDDPTGRVNSEGIANTGQAGTFASQDTTPLRDR
ncbi:MAG: hypothetical protein NVS3B7_08040 [Candidatus Elarobacter sp.]